MLRRIAVVVGTLLLAACGSSSSEEADPNERVGDIRGAVVWKPGTKLTGIVRIFEGASVEIEPGAQISCTESTQIFVAGTLRVRGGGAAHAAIRCSAWSGIIVAQNGSLDITALDLENASTGYESTTGSGAITINDSLITKSSRPFIVRERSTITANRVTVTTPPFLGDFEVSVSQVWGKLNARYLSYQASGNEGIMTMRGGETDIEDSTIMGENAFDLVSAYGAKSVVVKYSTLRGAHCGGHIDASKDTDRVPTENFTFEKVTSENNQFGITIYAAAMQGGTLLVKDSNFSGTNSWLDIQGDHGVITFDNVYTQGRQLVMNTDPPTVTAATAPIADAKPR